MKFHFRHHDVGGVIVPTDHPSSLLVIDAHGRHVDDMLDSPRSMAAEYEHRVGDGEHHSSLQAPENIERDLDASRHHGECTHQKMDAGSTSSSSTLSSSVVPCQNGPNFLEAQQSTNNFHSSDVESGSPTSSSGSSSPTSKRALHLEDGECPHSQRPRSRPFFRLGRHRSRLGKKEQSAASSSTINDGFSSNVPLVDKRTYGTVGCFSDSSDTGEEEGEEEDDEMNLLQGGHRGGGVANIHRRRSKGISRLRKPLLRRTQSLPIQSIAKPQPDNIINSKEEGDSITGGSNSSSKGGLAKIVSTTSLTSTATTADINSPTLTKQQRTHRRHVTFTSVSVRQYSTILGDHPCCPSGPPLALGWKFTEQGSMEFETYETQREPERVKSKDKLRLDGDERRGILRSLVVSTTTASIDPSSSNDAQPSDSSCTENSDAKKKDDSTTTVCVYTQRELARAERRLTRERASNNRAHQRMNRKFFRPLTAEECEIGSSSDSVAVPSSASQQEGEEGKTKIDDDVGCCTSPSPMKVIDEPLEENRMDISPVNLRMTFASSDRMSFDEADESSV